MVSAAHRRVGEIPQIEPGFRHQLLSVLLEGTADLELTSGVHGQCSGQRAHEQTAADALVAARRVLQARAAVIDGRLKAGAFNLAT